MASLKAVILSISPQVHIVDVAHEVGSYHIERAAYIIGNVFHRFPKGTIHVCVVDPGVGSDRLPILVQTENHFFVGPNNGVFSMVPFHERVKAVYHLNRDKFFSNPVSDTFHGRDIFSPVAAHLANWVPARRLGTRINDFHVLKLFACEVKAKKIKGHIIYIDKFGNAVTNISQEMLKAKIKTNKFCVNVRCHQISGLNRTYSNVPKGKPIFLVGSDGLAELAMNQKSLASTWKLEIGDEVIVSF